MQLLPVLEKLEFNKVLKAVAKYCITAIGKQNVYDIVPFGRNGLAFKEGNLTNQAKDALINTDIPPFENMEDLNEPLSTSRIEGASLSAKSIIQIYQLAVCSRNTISFLKRNAETAPDLAEYTERLFLDKVFEMHITRVFNEAGEIKDSASKELAAIRADVREKSNQLQKLIRRIAKELSDEDLLREDYLTLRDGRMVVPIRVEHKRHLKGFIHSESASGQTVYMEPEETLNLNNEIVTLHFAEKREIEKILRDLTRKIGESSYQLQDALHTIAFLDAIFARAQYSIEIIGSYPDCTDDKPMYIIDARHPLLIQKLGREKTIPLTLQFQENRIVIITGPNAGGKTVVLKTIGLLSAMYFAGLHIPVSPDSNFNTIDSIFIDIGDQQSIEEDLSTFSSHLSNIRAILQNATARTIVLLDELGTGTDPVAGAALATATLMKLRDLKSFVLSTTHHGNLKTLALSDTGFENAAMEFDTENLRPTYRFKQGVPGSSYAFEIAGRLGFAQEFIQLAHSYLEKDEQRLEKALIMVEQKEQILHNNLKFYEVENARLKGLASMYQKRVEQIEREKNEILRKTKDEAREFIHKANREVEQIIKELKENQAHKETVKAAKQTIQAIRNDMEKIAIVQKTVQEPLDLKPGTAVKIKETGTIGTVIEVYPEKKTTKILAGAMPMTIAISQLEAAAKSDVKAAAASLHFTNTNAMSERLDIRGHRPEESEFEVIHFLDEAYSSGLSRVEILHGKGTGVLKKMVKNILNEHIGIKKYYFANVEYGGEGITIVELKN
ncbi:MAG: endonuclease MutS2 [Ignavibacteriales bacterium]|nr:endonuclease MutS2 [Ignavibacteriales bacterium]